MQDRNAPPDVGLANLRFASALIAELQAAGAVTAIV